jgi:hypothetical protein
LCAIAGKKVRLAKLLSVLLLAALIFADMGNWAFDQFLSA